jgi:hypothetical protein
MVLCHPKELSFVVNNNYTITTEKLKIIFVVVFTNPKH